MRTNYSSYVDRRKHYFQVSIPIFSLLYPNIGFASLIYQDYQNSLKFANLFKTLREFHIKSYSFKMLQWNSENSFAFK